MKCLINFKIKQYVIKCFIFYIFENKRLTNVTILLFVKTKGFPTPSFNSNCKDCKSEVDKFTKSI